MLFDQFATMTKSATAGLGVALLPDYLTDHESNEGLLVPLFQRGIATGGSHGPCAVLTTFPWQHAETGLRHNSIEQDCHCCRCGSMNFAKYAASSAYAFSGRILPMY
jgi:DNA-binding transcriptional LysR family regulator